jgi:hypothetical protein
MNQERRTINEERCEFFFDASTLEHKRANEKRELVYEFTVKRDDGALVFATAYSEKGRKTKLDDIMRQLHKLGVEVKEEAVERAFRVFERQSEELRTDQRRTMNDERITKPQVLKDIALKNLGFVKSPMEAPS